MRIAVIGAGVSGLVAALRLQERHEVVVLEAGDYVGGHTHTHEIELNGERHAVDSGFIVFNRQTYPNFCALLDELGVESQPTDMSFSVRWDERDLEYAGTGVSGLFAQRRNLISPQFWALLADWWRFNGEAASALKNLDDTVTVADFFRNHRYSDVFRRGYFLPLGSAVWSSPQSAFEDFPVRFVLEFYRNHGMLGLPGRVKWRVIRGGSRRYVEAILKRLDSPVRTKSRVAAVSRRCDQVEVCLIGQEPQTFDHVVFACHSDQAVRLLGSSATQAEHDILAAFPYQRNTAVLHTDTSVLPRSRRAWASWNYRLSGMGDDAATVTYDMTRLQRLSTNQRFLVTLNSDEVIAPAKVLRRMTYHHPVFTTGRAAAQRRYGELINHYGASYCGAYWGNGFHEDGVNSALAVSRVLNEACNATKHGVGRSACLPC
jgi:predicted NAD/FAD-binding protein